MELYINEGVEVNSLTLSLISLTQNTKPSNVKRGFGARKADSTMNSMIPNSLELDLRSGRNPC